MRHREVPSEGVPEADSSSSSPLSLMGLLTLSALQLISTGEGVGALWCPGSGLLGLFAAHRRTMKRQWASAGVELSPKSPQSMPTESEMLGSLQGKHSLLAGSLFREVRLDDDKDPAQLVGWRAAGLRRVWGLCSL